MFIRSFRSLRAFFPSARLALRLLREPRVPMAAKAIPLLGVLYLVSPVDFIPAAILPIIGGLDDLGVLILALKAFPYACPHPAVEHHQASIARREPYTPLPPEADFIDV